MKKLFLLCFLLFLPPGISFSQTVSLRITVGEDTYVFSNGGADNNVIRQFDNPGQLKSYTHQSLDSWTYRTFLKFDISAICSNANVIESCTLKIVGKENQGSFQHKISLYALVTDAWAEDELTYANHAPLLAGAEKIVSITKTVGTADKWFDFPITDKIKEYRAAGRNLISLMLTDDNNVRNPDNNQGSIITFYSKEAEGTNHPRLAVDQNSDHALCGDTLIAGDAPTVNDDTPLPPLDIYLCIGQSNMAGRGYTDATQGDNLPLENAWLFNSQDTFEPATNPMNKYSNIRKELGIQEISPVWGFAKHLDAHYPQVKTGIIVNARGGTSIEEWQKGQNLYEQTVARTQKALPYGTLRGILWHQGESNSSAAKAAAYPAQLAQMAADFRADLHAPDAFFVAGELLYSYSGANTFNPMIRTIAAFLPSSDWVSAEGLVSRGDNVHFDRAGNITLGERYAAKVIDKYYRQTSVGNTRPNDIFITIKNNVVSLQNTPADAQISLFDLSGKKVLEKSLGGNAEFTVAQKGIYVLSLVCESLSMTKKIVVL